MSLIEIRDLYFRYSSDDRAVNGVSIDINEGEFVCVLGHNGSGKSTLAKLLVGLLKAKSGSIKIKDIELTEKTVDDLRQHIGIVFQNPDNQFVGVTVKDDIAFGLENRQVETTIIKELVNEYAKKVSMEKFLESSPEKLSGGEKQRITIARALLKEAPILLLDEPTASVDISAEQIIQETIEKLMIRMEQLEEEIKNLKAMNDSD